MQPSLVDFLAARSRPAEASSQKDHPGMTAPRKPVIDADAQESVRRLVDLMQVLLPSRPKVIEAIERCVLALVVDEMRQRITDRLARFTPEEISTVEALTAHIAQQRGDEPPLAPDEAG
jgi:hypothetical protein